ncbi:MAG: elongator complex protein 3 [Anaerolineales bacterium]
MTESKTGDHRFSDSERKLASMTLDDIESGMDVFKAIRHHPLPDGVGFLSKHTLVSVYREQVKGGERTANQSLFKKIRLKPMRTLSGVTTVTVLTKPHPCPGRCIFCPDFEEMPVSYLPDEPGAMRALHHGYDPYTQVASRIQSLHEIGHPTDKIELLILGGSWSAYGHEYQEWFIKRCFDAMNEEDSATLQDAQALNETARHKNVGLVLETRPDLITPRELARMRGYGATKLQMGVQSLDDRILDLNQRGHTVAEAKEGVALLRAAGFKIVLHWMPNLLGATLESDREDFARLWEDFSPDEIKIYPTQLLRDTGLYQVWERGEYRPYTTEELIDLIADVKLIIPRYCRVNRVVRDIPSQNVVEGNKRTSLRQDIQRELASRGQSCSCIRCREVRGQEVDVDELVLNELVYSSNGCREYFLSFDTPDDSLAGFTRLCLPGPDAADPGIPELAGAAIIREVHVYGESLPVGREKAGVPQHSGLGTALLEEAERIAASQGYSKIAVISAVGTRGYYLDRGYARGDLYLLKALNQ